MGDPAHIEPHSSVHAFFYEKLERALRQEQVSVTQETEWYVVQLLVEKAHQPICDEPLAVRFAHARNAPPPEQARELRDLGDNALIVSGFFGESLNRKLVDVDYYIKMGSAAYGEAGNLLRFSAPRADLASVLEEAASRFPGLVSALNAVSTESTAKSMDMTQLCEKWLKTRNPTLERELIAQGVVLPKGESES